MKTKFYDVTFLCAAAFGINKTNAQANQSLSNLTTPTAVNTNLLPNNENRTLGSTGKRWKTIYLDSFIFLNNKRFIVSSFASDSGNTGIGAMVLNSTTTGSLNTAGGYQTLYSNTIGSYNTAYGYEALYSNASGVDNTAIGFQALYSNTSPSNTAVGYRSLYTNSTGIYNVALGEYSLIYNTSGSENTALGFNALRSNTTASANTGIGDEALAENTTGYSNTATGSGALGSNTTGFYNTATGASALNHNTTAIDNTATGYGTLFSDTSGSYNVADGLFALYSNTNGAWNTANGMEALYANTTGTSNTADGYNALAANNFGSHNTAIGFKALYVSTNASYNTALGEYAGSNVTNGSNNTFIGYYANCGSGGHLTNSVAIGNNANVTTNNTVRIGNSSITSIGGYANWSNLSDGRVKKNIKQNVPGLEFINKLQPITYNLDLDAADKILAIPAIKDKDEKIIQPSANELTARKAKEQIVYTGFIAQDVEKAAKGLNYDFSGVDKPDNANTLYGLRYSDFVVPLVKAVQELSKMNNEKDSAIANLQQQINDLKQMMVANQSTPVPLNAGVNGQQSTVNSLLSSASLSQNSPNPFSNTTTINYSLPQQFSSAKIIVTDKMGNTLKQINLPAGRQGLSGNKGSVNVDAATLSSGAYQYSLYVDGRLIGSKQMMLSK